MSPHLARIAVCIAMCLTVGAASAALGPFDAWHQTLRKPAWMPPGWMFGVVRIPLYVLMGVSLASVLARGWTSPGVRRATLLFAVQLTLGAAWSPIFFRLHNVGGALLVIVVAWMLVGWTVGAFWSVRDVAGALLLPYWAWVTFAVGLNGTMWRTDYERCVEKEAPHTHLTITEPA